MKLHFKNLDKELFILIVYGSSGNNMAVGEMIRVFGNGLEDLCSISDRVISKTQKLVLDASLLITRHYKVWINGKWSNPRKGAVHFLHLGVVAIERGTFGSISTKADQITR